MAVKPIAVQGLREFASALRRMDAEAPKALRTVANACADFLIAKVRPKIPRITGAARGSLQARSTRTAVRVGIGGKRAPYYPWLDFGGAVGPKKATKRPFYSDGRYLYPTYHDEQASLERLLQDGIVDLAEDSGMEVS